MIRSTRSGIYLGELGSKKITRLLDASSSAIYSKGHLLFSRRGELMAQPFDLKAGRVTGEAFIRVKGVGAHALRNAGFFSATMDGDLVVRQASQGDVMREVVFIDRRGFQHGEARFKDTYQALSLTTPMDAPPRFTGLRKVIGQKSGLWNSSAIAAAASLSTVLFRCGPEMERACS